MKRTVYFVLIGVFTYCVLAEDVDKSLFTISAERVIKTSDRNSLTKEIIAFVDSIGGYYLRQDKKQLHLKIPMQFVDTMLTYLDSCGVILQKSYQRDDLTNSYWQHHSKLTAKTALLKDFLKMLEQAGDKGIFTVEKSVISLQKEIEEEQGKLNKIVHQTQYANVLILFEFPLRRTPLATGDSNFKWLNKLNLQDLLRDYAYDY